MKRYIIVILIILLGGTQTKAQTENYLPTVIPPSPTSAVFRQYGEHQPSLATGTINIPIPLFEVTDGDFSLPFTLCYNTSGITIFDRPVPAGYGWVLSPGLRITRTILSRADDQYPLRTGDIGDSHSSLISGILSDHNSWHSEFNTPKSSLYDSQQDIFTIHLPNGNYTFLIENTNYDYKVVTVGNLLNIRPLYDDKGTSSASSIYGFEVTDENGILYVFGRGAHNDEHESHVESPGNDGAQTAWMLRQIKLPNNQLVKFSWGFGNIAAFDPRVDAAIVLKDQKSIGENGLPELLSQGGQGNSYSYNLVSILTKIEFRGGIVELDYKDSEKKQFLNKIVMKDKSGSLIKNIEFYYGKEKSTAEYLLTDLKINKEIYKFTYNPQTFSKNTAGIDYWGYYNGKNNQNRIPKVQLRLSNRISGDPVHDNYSETHGTADRSVSPEHMKAFILTRIDYPTGGYSEFEYEPHKFKDKLPYSTSAFATIPNPINQGGGLRITTIRSKADSDAALLVKTYKYGENENGLANIEHVPTLDTFLEEVHALDSYPPYAEPFYRRLTLNCFSSYTKYLITTPPIWYSKVTEYVNDYKTESSFDYIDDSKELQHQCNLLWKSYITSYNSLFENGPRLLRQTKYLKKDQGYTPVEEASMYYSSELKKYISNNIIERQIILTAYNSSELGWGVNPDFYFNPKTDYPATHPFVGENPYRTINYHINLRYHSLKSKTTTVYNNGVPIMSKEDYVYKKPVLPEKITASTSNSSDSIVTTFKYPDDYTTGIYPTMKAKNILSPVIEKKTFLKTSGTLKELNRVMTNYALFNGTMYKPSTIQTSNAGGGLSTEVTFNNYDKYGNIKLMTTKDGRRSYYLWSYNGQYPIAEINHAPTLDITETAIKETLSKAASIDIITDKQSLSYLDTVNVRNLRNHANLKQSLINTFTYRPLVGMIAAVDPAGLTTNYNYDDFGRLASITDGNNQKLNEYSYHYVGPTYPEIVLQMESESTFDISSSYKPSAQFSITASGGSGRDFNYKWIHKLPNNKTVTYNGDTRIGFQIKSEFLGTNTMTCIVEDKLSGVIKEITKTFKVTESTSFKDIEISNEPGSSYRALSANFYCENSGYITFEVSANKSDPDTRLYIKLGYSEVIEVSEEYGYSGEVKVYCPAGGSYIHLSVNGNDGTASISVQMKSITNNRLGSSTYVVLNPA